MPGALTTDKHQGYAITGIPVLVYYCRNGIFFNSSTRRHSVEFAKGGFQPLTSPSLIAYQPPTPPGYAFFIKLTDYTQLPVTGQ
jgi:hypothetical protein